MKQRGFTILTVSLILIGMLAVMLLVFVDQAHEEFKENIRVSENGVTEEVLSVRDLMLNPADQKQYEIKLTCPASGSFDITLDHEEIKNGGMKQFINVRIFCDEREVYCGTLVDLLDRGTLVTMQAELHATEPTVLRVVYEMPYETGNEAQGTYADFNIHLKIEKSDS